MTPDEALALSSEHALTPTTTARYAEWVEDWRTFMAGFGLPAEISDAGLASIWLADAAVRRAVNSRPMLSEDTLRYALAGLNRFLIGLRLEPVGADPRVKEILAAARLGWVSEPGPLPLTPRVARVVLALAPPTAPAHVVRTRLVLDAAVRVRQPVTAAASAMRIEHGWSHSQRKWAVAVLRRAAQGPAGPALIHDPAGMCPQVLARAAAWLDVGAVRHERQATAMALGWHWALTGADLSRLTVGDLAFADGSTRVVGSVRGTPRSARLAREPVLCAVRRTASWLALLGPQDPKAPLFSGLTADGPTGQPLTPGSWTARFEATSTAAGLHVQPQSMVNGFVVTAAAQGAPLHRIAAALGAADLDNLARRLTENMAFVALAAAPAPRATAPGRVA